MVQFGSFLKKSPSFVSTCEETKGKKSRSKHLLYFRKRQSKKNNSCRDGRESCCSDSTTSDDSHSVFPLTVKSCLKSSRSEQCDRSPVTKQVRWQSHLSSEAPPTLVREDYGDYWWSHSDLKEFRKQGSQQVKSEAASLTYIMECKRAYNSEIPALEKTLKGVCLSEEAPESKEEHWSNVLLTPSIVDGLKNDCRGLERQAISRKERAKDKSRTIVRYSRTGPSEEVLAAFSYEVSFGDTLWAHAFAIGDSMAVRE